MYEVIIIGGGPAGAAAAVYTARKRLKTLLIAEEFGGQSIVSADVQNWIGEPHISGYDLAQKLERHVRSFSDIVDVRLPEKAVAVSKEGCDEETGVCYPPGVYIFKVATDKGVYLAKTVIFAAGARRKKLGIPGEKEYDGKGVSYCSTCDAPLFQDKAVAVIGGGNAGLEAAVDLLPYAKKIYLLEFSSAIKGDPVTKEKIEKSAKAAIVFNAETKEIFGDKFVSGLKYNDLVSREEKKLDIQGIFVERGSVPNTEMLEGLVDLDEWGHIKIDSKYATTSCAGFFAAGDATDDPFKQNNIAVGDAVKAALSASEYILKGAKVTKAII